MIYNTIKKIDNILKRISEHDEFSQSTMINFQSAMKKEAITHSLGIERLLNDENNKIFKKNKKQINQHFLNIQNAREFLVENGINLSTLAVLGKEIEPLNHPYKFFRIKDVMFGEFEPPSPHNVIYEVNNLVDRINDNNLHPILRSIEAHIGLVQIHPYLDGNGRAARLVQNVILNDNGYPVLITPKNERYLYIGLMKKTMRDRYAKKSNIYNPSEDEMLLHDFFTGKLHGTCDQFEKNLLKNRQYQIILYNSVPNVGYGIAKELRKYGHSDGRRGIRVSVNKINNGKKQVQLKVSGDICFVQLGKKVSILAQKRQTRYELIKGED